MLERPEIVRMAQELAAHAGTRQAIIARNIANADTPGYRAMDVPPFSEMFSSFRDAVRTTRPGHMAAMPPGERMTPQKDANAEASPNGNSVSIESQMTKAAEVRQAHGLALAVYKSSLDMMRAALGRGR